MCVCVCVCVFGFVAEWICVFVKGCICVCMCINVGRNIFEIPQLMYESIVGNFLRRSILQIC